MKLRASDKRRPVLWIFLGIFAASLIVAAPYIWSAGSFYKAKLSARQALGKFDAESLRNLNVVPTSVVLQPSALDPDSPEVIELGGYAIHVSRPSKRTNSGKAVVLAYPRYDVRVRLPFSIAENDRLARQLNFKDAFDQSAAMYRTRPADLNAAKNVQDLKRFLFLISQKPPREPCREDFTVASLRGFIHEADPFTKMSVVEIYDTAHHIGIPLWITDRNGLTPDDIHAFLSAIEVTASDAQKTPPVTSN